MPSDADIELKPSESGLTSYLTIFLKGLFMGTADAIPGVSGGTIALIVGIYERLITAIAAIDPSIAVNLLLAYNQDHRAELRRQLDDMDVVFLIVLGSGITTAVIIVTRLLAFGLVEYRALTNAFFFGLIAASAIVLYGEVNVDTPKRILTAIAAVVAAFILTGFTASGQFPHGFPIILVAGTVTSAAMLLPGISGAALLYVLGQYEYLSTTLHAFLDALVALLTGGSLDAVIRPGSTVLVFIVGVGIGLLSIARIVRWALSRDRQTTLTILVSLMVGALRLPAEEVLTHTAQWTVETGLFTAGIAFIGILLVLGLDRYTDDLDY